MSNSLLTIDMITRKALVILHQKLNFIGNMNRQYDAEFGREGRQIGDTLRIRLPNEYTVQRNNLVWTPPQTTVEASVALPVSQTATVPLVFSDQDMTLRVDDFAARYLEPAMARMAADIESNAFSMINRVSQVVDNIGAPISARVVGRARKVLQDALAPTNDRVCILNTQDNLDFVDSVKGLFQDSSAIREQYREGIVGRTGGFDFYENTLIPASTTGTAASATGYTVNGAGQTGTGVVLATGSNTFAVGDVVTFAGCFRVHPETKVSTGDLMQFTVTAAYAGGAGTLQISPAIVTTGGRQNVSASPTNGGAVVKVGGASAVYRQSVAFQKDAFTFVTADLELPKGTDMAYRARMDNISMRVIRDFDSVNARWITRADVLYGFAAIRPELAVRILSN